jgi:uncharacterized membrane protein YhdT
MLPYFKGMALFFHMACNAATSWIYDIETSWIHVESIFVDIPLCF